MCFSEPGRVCSIDGSDATIATSDGRRDVSLRLVEAAGERVEVGDWVLVSLGLVVRVVEADETQLLFDELSAMKRGVAS